MASTPGLSLMEARLPSLNARKKWVVLSERPSDEASGFEHSEGSMREKDLAHHPPSVHGETVRDLLGKTTEAPPKTRALPHSMVP